MNQSCKILVIAILSAALFCRCVDLKEVNAFAVASHQVFATGVPRSFGFYQYCHDSTYIFHYLPKHLRDLDCDCDGGKKADSVLAMEYYNLSLYFAALARLSDPKSSITADTLGNAIKAGTYGPITISTTESGMAASISAALRDLITTGYKSKKKKHILPYYNDSIQYMIGQLKLHAQNIEGRIINLGIEVTHVADSLISYTKNEENKWPMLFSYEQKMAAFDQDLIIYRAIERNIDKIISAQQFICDHIDDLKSESFRKKLATLVSDLKFNAN